MKTEPSFTAEQLSIRGIPLRYHRWTLADYNNDKRAKKVIQAYLDGLENNLEEGNGFLLCGPNGTGKTTLGVIILKACLALNQSSGSYITAQLAPWPSVLDAKTATWSQPDLRWKYADMVLAPRVLQLDDVGKEAGAGGELSRSTLDAILRNRINRKRVTIITTNSSPHGFVETYGESIASLVRGSLAYLEVDGNDMRDLGNSM